MPCSCSCAECACGENCLVCLCVHSSTSSNSAASRVQDVKDVETTSPTSEYVVEHEQTTDKFPQGESSAVSESLPKTDFVQQISSSVSNVLKTGTTPEKVNENVLQEVSVSPSQQKHLKMDSLIETSFDSDPSKVMQYHSPSKISRKHLSQTDPSTVLSLKESDDSLPSSFRKVPRRKLQSISPEISFQKELLRKISYSPSNTESVEEIAGMSCTGLSSEEALADNPSLSPNTSKQNLSSENLSSLTCTHENSSDSTNDLLSDNKSNLLDKNAYGVHSTQNIMTTSTAALKPLISTSPSNLSMRFTSVVNKNVSISKSNASVLSLYSSMYFWPRAPARMMGRSTILIPSPVRFRLPVPTGIGLKSSGTPFVKLRTSLTKLETVKPVTSDGKDSNSSGPNQEPISDTFQSECPKSSSHNFDSGMWASEYKQPSLDEVLQRFFLDRNSQIHGQSSSEDPLPAPSFRGEWFAGCSKTSASMFEPQKPCINQINQNRGPTLADCPVEITCPSVPINEYSWSSNLDLQPISGEHSKSPVNLSHSSKMSPFDFQRDISSVPTDEDSCSSIPDLVPIPGQYPKSSGHGVQNESYPIQCRLQEETFASNSPLSQDSNQLPVQEMPDILGSFVINVELKMKEPHRLSIADVWVEPGSSESRAEEESSQIQQERASTSPDSYIIRLHYDIDQNQTQSQENFSISLSRVQLQESIQSIFRGKSQMSSRQNLPRIELPNNLPLLQVKISTLCSDQEHRSPVRKDQPEQNRLRSQHEPLASDSRIQSEMNDMQIQNQEESHISDSKFQLNTNLKSDSSQPFVKESYDESFVSDSHVKVKIENVQSPAQEVPHITDSTDSLQSRDQEELYAEDSSVKVKIENVQSPAQEVPHITDSLQSRDQAELYAEDSHVKVKIENVQSPYEENSNATDSTDSLQSRDQEELHAEDSTVKVKIENV